MPQNLVIFHSDRDIVEDKFNQKEYTREFIEDTLSQNWEDAAEDNIEMIRAFCSSIPTATKMLTSEAHSAAFTDYIRADTIRLKNHKEWIKKNKKREDDYIKDRGI